MPADALATAAWVQLWRGMLLAISGRLEEGRDLVRRGREVFEDLGAAITLGSSSHPAAVIEELADDLDAAERELRVGYASLDSFGEKGFLSTVVGALARYVAMRGDLDEAETFTRIAEQATATEDLYSQVLWRQARALIDARQGASARALALALEATELARPTDDVVMRTAALEDLAEVHRVAGRLPEASEALRRAIDLWDRKGAVLAADRLRDRLAELTAP